MKQEAVLAVFAVEGTKTAAARLGEVSRPTIDRWLADNVNGFRDAWDKGRQEHNDQLEAKLYELCLGLKPGQNCTALIFALNGAMPEKYRPGVHLPSTQAAELLKKLEALGGTKVVKKAANANDEDADLSPQAQVEAILRAAREAGEKD